MPYKDSQRYRRYMQKYMKQRRSTQRQMKRQMLRDTKNIENLRKNFPTAYELLFGKRRKS